MIALEKDVCWGDLSCVNEGREGRLCVKGLWTVDKEVGFDPSWFVCIVKVRFVDPMMLGRRKSIAVTWQIHHVDVVIGVGSLDTW